VFLAKNKLKELHSVALANTTLLTNNVLILQAYINVVPHNV